LTLSFGIPSPNHDLIFFAVSRYGTNLERLQKAEILEPSRNNGLERLRFFL
jgi:hypothetical protein